MFWGSGSVLFYAPVCVSYRARIYNVEFAITKCMSTGSWHKDKIGVICSLGRLEEWKDKLSSVLAGAIRAGAHPALPRVGHKVAPFLSILLREPPLKPSTVPPLTTYKAEQTKQRFVRRVGTNPVSQSINPLYSVFSANVAPSFYLLSCVV